MAQWATVPKSEHPLVWKRQDGRRSLVMGSTAEAVIDMPDDEGQALLRRLLDWATQPGVHLVAFVARGRPRDLRQHRPAPPSHAVLGDVAAVDAPGDDRRRRSLRLMPRIAAVQATTIGMLS